MSIETRVIDGFSVLALRHIGPYPTIGHSFAKLHEYLSQHGLKHGLNIGIFYSDPGTVPAAELVSDACVVIEDTSQLRGLTDPPERGSFHVVHVPGGNYAVTTHMGSYEGLPNAWHRFMEEFSSSGFNHGDGFEFEMYMNDCSEVPEAEVRTDIYASIAN
jgi:AraC family transcriptional regulator